MTSWCDFSEFGLAVLKVAAVMPFSFRRLGA